MLLVRMTCACIGTLLWLIWPAPEMLAFLAGGSYRVDTVVMVLLYLDLLHLQGGLVISVATMWFTLSSWVGEGARGQSPSADCDRSELFEQWWAFCFVINLPMIGIYMLHAAKPKSITQWVLRIFQSLVSMLALYTVVYPRGCKYWHPHYLTRTESIRFILLVHNLFHLWVVVCTNNERELERSGQGHTLQPKKNL